MDQMSERRNCVWEINKRYYEAFSTGFAGYRILSHAAAHFPFPRRWFLRPAPEQISPLPAISVLIHEIPS